MHGTARREIFGLPRLFTRRWRGLATWPSAFHSTGLSRTLTLGRELLTGLARVIVSAESVDQAKATIQALPPAANGFLGFEFIPVGPLKPLGLLIQGK